MNFGRQYEIISEGPCVKVFVVKVTGMGILLSANHVEKLIQLIPFIPTINCI